MSYWKTAIVRVWDGLPHKNGRFAGTAFFIDSKTLLTAKHVIEGCEGTIYLDGVLDGAKEKIDRETNIYCDEKRDVAVLKTNRAFSDITPLHFSRQDIQEEQDVMLAGFFDESQAVHTIPSSIGGYVGVQHTWRVPGSISRGMSGGPVLSTDGKTLLGILQARDTDKNIAYLIPTDVIESTLAKFTTVQTLAPVFNAPSLPAHYLERNEHLAQIRTLLLQAPQHNVGITGIARAVGLQGMGGIGKSILAAAIAYDTQIRTAFHDGVIWVSLGQAPDIVALQRQVIQSFSETENIPESPKHGQIMLQRLLMDKQVLLILDDVWQTKHAAYFDVVTTPAKRLITTRLAHVVGGISAKEHRIDVLTSQQALRLLRVQSNWQEADLPEEAKLIVAECGALPLAISMVGAMLRGKPHRRWNRALKHLQQANLQKIGYELTHYEHDTLFKALHVSVEAQPALIQKRYIELAVFPEDIPIPEQVLDIYWGEDDLGSYDTEEIIDELLDASLLFRHDEDLLSLHDLQRDYIRSQVKDLTGLHYKIIDAYKRAYPGGWHSVPYQSPYYFFTNFTFHIGQIDDTVRKQEIALDLLSNQHYLHWGAIQKLIRYTDLTPEQLAPQLIKTNQQPSTITACLNILGAEIKKEEAHRLLSELAHPNVIVACLKILGEEAKEEARCLLTERAHPIVVESCLKILGEEAKEEAHNLLVEHAHPSVIVACLKILGEEAKEEAHHLLAEHANQNVILACLKILGRDAKEEAHHLLAEHANQNVILACLKILGMDAKEEASHFLQSSNDRAILLTSLRIVEDDNEIASLLDNRRKKQLDSLIDHVLKKDIRNPIQAIKVLNNWSGYRSSMVAAAFAKFNRQPEKVILPCREILLQWEDEIQNCVDGNLPKKSWHIVQSMSHPQLKQEVKKVATDMLLKETAFPGFLTDDLFDTASAIVEHNTYPKWEEMTKPEHMGYG